MSRPTHATPGGHAYLELQRRARAAGLGTQELLIWYVHERFLYRLSRSDYRDRLILKGGMLLVAFEARRATQDIDLLGRQIANDVSAIAAMISAIAQIDVADGVEFAVDQITTGAIRGETDYGGVRIAMPAMVDRAKATLRVDIRDTNTRERDVADIVVLARRHRPDDDELAAAIAATAAYRDAHVQPIRDAVRELGAPRPRSWETFVERAGLVGSVPENYTSGRPMSCR